MASIQRVRRIANPRKRRFASRMTRNASGRFIKRARAKTRRSHRRRATGSSKSNPSPRIRRYSVKTLKSELRRRGASPSTSKVRRHRRRTTVRRNPVLIELGAINPRRRKANVAQRKRKRVYRRRSNPRAAAPRRRRRYTARRTHRRRTRRSVMMMNPVHRRRRYTRRRRTMNSRRRYNGRRHYRRNPAIFGSHSGKDLLVMTGGVLVGVAATKYIPTILPSSITSLGGGSPWMGVLITAGGAFAAGWAARKFGGNTFGDAVLLGGLAQVGSQVLTIVAPPSLTSALALSGMGDIIPGMFVVPQNPIKAGMPAPMLPVAKTPPSGVGAFRGAFGARR